jgi:hypothetical protein
MLNISEEIVMKEYPSIDRVVRGSEVYAFDKLDGQNIRVEWDKKKMFHQFGSRHQIITKDDSQHRWAEAIEKVHGKYEKDLHDLFVKNRFQKAVAFFEFHGPNSFAGKHTPEKLDVTLIDLRVHKKGLLLPKDYLKMVGHLDIAKLLYHGEVNDTFVESVRESTLEGLTCEGVVCKGDKYDRPGLPLMFKVKTKVWLSKLVEYCHGDSKLFENLS